MRTKNPSNKITSNYSKKLLKYNSFVFIKFSRIFCEYIRTKNVTK